jgi:hypothetical protein
MSIADIWDRLTPGQQQFALTHPNAATVEIRDEADHAVFYAYSDLRVTRYIVAGSGTVLDEASFRATPGDLQKASELSVVPAA